MPTDYQLDSPRADHRLKALRVLVAARPEDLAARLIPFLDDPNPPIQRYVLNRLCDLGAAAVPALTAAAADDDGRGRACVLALANTMPGREALAARPDRGVDLLLAALNDPGLATTKAIQTLRELATDYCAAAQTVLQGLLDHAHVTVRAAAAEALAARTAAQQHLSTLLDHCLHGTIPPLEPDDLRRMRWLDDPRIPPLLHRLAGREGRALSQELQSAAQETLDRIAAADAGVPDGALSHAARPAGVPSPTALSRAPEDEGA